MKKILFILLLLLAGISLHAQNEPGGKFITKYRAVPNNYNFWIYTPDDYEPGGHPLPLIIFLHGKSLCGTDLNKVKRYGVLNAIERGKYIPTFVLAPQNPGGSWNPQKLYALLEWMKANYPIDSTRVYVLGMSLGGYGTMDFAGTYPDKIAAAMALCGGTTLSDSQKDGLGRLPMWIMHGTADRAVPVSCSKTVVEYLKKNKKDSLLRYWWLPGASHGTLARLFYLQKTYDWLFTHSLKDSPRVVDRSFDITMDDIKTTYEELKWSQDMFEDD